VAVISADKWADVVDEDDELDGLLLRLYKV
jgi:hypothetical protein